MALIFVRDSRWDFIQGDPESASAGAASRHCKWGIDAVRSCVQRFRAHLSLGGTQQGVPVVGVSHQIAVHHPDSPKPLKMDSLGMAVLKHYAPCSHPVGFHFRYAPQIHTPVIRRKVREEGV